MNLKLNYKNTILIGLAFMSISSFWVIYDSIIPLILKNTFKIDDLPAGIIMSLDNILALFLLPLFGFFSDRTKTKIGKRMPYIIIGTAFSSVLMLLIPIVDKLENCNIYVFITVLALLLISLSTYRSPAVSLMPDVTPKPLRSKANAVINLMGIVGGIVSFGCIAILVPQTIPAEEMANAPRELLPNYFPLFLAVSLFMIFSVIVLFFTVDENKLSKSVQLDEPGENTDSSKPEKLDKAHLKSLIFILVSVALWFMGYNAVTSAFSKYAQEMWNMTVQECTPIMIIAQVVAVMCFIPIGFLSTKYGRKKIVMAGVACLIVAFFAAIFIHSSGWYVIALFVVAGIGWAAINVNSYPMVVEMSKGSNVGKYTGYYYSFSMAAQIVTPILSGWLLDRSYKTLFPYAFICCVFAFITMIFVKHGDSKPLDKKSKLEIFDVD